MNLIFNNGQIVALLFVFILIASGVSFYFFQPQGFPSFNINMAFVTVPYPGATALQVEDQIVKPIEQAISQVKGVEEYSSTSNDSFGMVSVTLKDGIDMATAIQDLNRGLAKVEMPEGVDKPEATEIDVVGPTAIVAVTLNGSTESSWELYHKADIVRKELELIQGVKSVKITNALTPEIQIRFDSQKLAQFGLQRSQVEGILKTAQLEMPIASFFDASQEKVSLSVKKSLEKVEDVENLLVGAPNVRLKDVANVEIVLNNNDYYNRVGYRENYRETEIADAGEMKLSRSLMLAITASDKQDIIALGKRLDDKYTELEDRSDLGGGLKIVEVYDMAEQTADQLKEIKESIIGGPIDALGPWGVIGYLFGGITLVVLFLLIFVNWRVAVLAGLSIPLAIGMTTAYLKMTDVTINTIVLFSMILVVGLVVDPTIVFLEAMQRHREQGYSGREAAIKTFNTVGLGVLLSAVANFLVFVPFGVVSGFFGQIIEYIPQTVIPAIVASFIVPVLFFLPVSAGWLKGRQRTLGTDESELVGVWSLSKAIGRMVEGLLAGTTAKKVLRFFIIMLAVIAPMAVGGAFLGTGQVRVVQFAQPDDAEMLVINGGVNERWSFDRALGVIDTVQEYLMKQPEVNRFAIYQQSGNSFTLFVDLFSSLERQQEDLRKANVLAEDWNRDFAAITEAEVEAVVEGAGPPEGEFPVSIRLFDADLEKLEKVAVEVKQFLQDQAGVTETEDSLNVDGDAKSGLQLILDNENLMNVSPFIAIGTLQNRMNENEIGSLKFGDDVYDVKTTLDKPITSIDEVRDLPLSLGAMGGGTAVPTRGVIAIPRVDSLVASVGEQKAQSIARADGRRYVEIRAKVDADTDPLKVQAELTKYLDDDKLASFGLSDTTPTQTKGIAGSVQTSFTELFIALLIALFLIYVLLVGFFRSILSPLIILFAVPLGFIGVFPAVAIATGELGFLELLGVVAMAGIVVNVTILIIDFANQMRARGMNAQEAIATSIAVRFKPILLTKMTVFAGLMPLALFSPFWRGLAVVIIFGIIVSGFLSFITTPILYVWFDALGKKVKRTPKVASPAPNNEIDQVIAGAYASRPSAGLWGELPNQANPMQELDQ